MYPLNIPAPSRQGKYTYANFLRETNLVRDHALKRRILETTRNDVSEFKWLRLKSDLRHPPMDTKGNIQPPRNFKKYKTRFVPPPTPEADSTSKNEVRMQVMWNRMLPNKPQPYLWKLSYKLNNPQYEQVQEEIRMRENFSRRRHLPKVSSQSAQ
ncbi:hypothetical protein LSAT2_013955 [Lamellibrachia satsuma]|nr:hypothetical protein LSAT2_013955 [Lamellibrachia satsuma]